MIRYASLLRSLTFARFNGMAGSPAEALDYALCSIGKTGLAIKDGQRRTVLKVFEGKDNFGYLLDSENCCVLSVFHLFLTVLWAMHIVLVRKA